MTVSIVQNHLRKSTILRRLIQPKRIPLLFSVTIVASIFYHYAPSMTWLWVLLATLLQAVFYRLFDFVNRHHILGGIAYCAVGIFVMTAALSLARAGYDSPFFAPDDPRLRISFFVWFMTPQSVLSTTYTAYTLALFLMFSFFIASITYYFTFVQYRVLMSFVSMIFPFAIYAKENEDMPVPAIILLFACYFAVMIYCRQANAENPVMVQAYAPEAQSRLKMPPKRSAFAGRLPEVLDGAFTAASGIFLAAACIVILVIPKPTVTADRTEFDNMLKMSAVSNYLMGAISGFTDSSDGGGRGGSDLNVALYYANADEPLNLRVRTFTDYSYAEDKWSASSYDKQPEKKDIRYRTVAWSGNVILQTVSAEQSPAELLETIRSAAQTDSAFAEKWHLTEFAAQTLDLNAAEKKFSLYANLDAMQVCPAPSHVTSSVPGMSGEFYQNSSDIIFHYKPVIRAESFNYISDAFSRTDAVQQLMKRFSAEEWSAFLLDLQKSAAQAEESTLRAQAQNAVDCYLAAVNYADRVHSQTPARVAALAHELTDHLHSDYEKASAICAYLKSGEYAYSLDFTPSDHDNVETFLFTNKQGVCYQFASAMAELCRAVGLPTRYIEGYAMQQENSGLGLNFKYIITTKHAHAFVEVFVAGYGWLMFDATASADLAAAQDGTNVIAALQYSGMILCIAAAVLIVLFVWIIPMLAERIFRRRFRKARNAAAVRDAFLRLRRQWKADPAATARSLCKTQSAFLQVDLSELLHAFELAVYAERCTPADADRAYAVYCAAHDAWRPACRRAKQAEKAAARAKKRAASA